mmetsp:Transcript_41129/g.100909  ORF Transcript_41129/g.100909 Transcript_41129/m.100909 type:complete len:221 (-) Transcript_41129:1033-1695(-)
MPPDSGATTWSPPPRASARLLVRLVPGPSTVSRVLVLMAPPLPVARFVVKSESATLRVQSAVPCTRSAPPSPSMLLLDVKVESEMCRSECPASRYTPPPERATFLVKLLPEMFTLECSTTMPTAAPPPDSAWLDEKELSLMLMVWLVPVMERTPPLPCCPVFLVAFNPSKSIVALLPDTHNAPPKLKAMINSTVAPRTRRVLSSPSSIEPPHLPGGQGQS